jgi:hypothetical protein
MKTAYWLSAAAGVMALGFTATQAPAASLGGAESLKTMVGEASDAQKVHWRHRHWRHRHYYYHRPYYYRPRYYYGGYPYYYRRHYGPRFGVWGPGFGFYVGPRRRYWW